MCNRPAPFCAVRSVLILVAAIVVGRTATAAEPAVIFDMDVVRHQPGDVTKDNKKIPAGTAELVDGKFAKAVKFSFVEGAQGGFMTARAPATADWDRAEGFSFWVKGDGSQNWGGIELVDKNDFGLRYGYCFPIDSTQWRKIVVPWRDLTPELAGPFVNPDGGYAPSGLGNFWFGKWFYWRDYPAHSYTIDQVALEPKIEAEAAPAFEPGLKRLRAKLAAHKPITIVTMGDSLSDDHHWSNRTILWSHLLAKDLKARYGSDVTLINPAIGGTTLSQNMVLIPRWVKQAPAPDLVAVWFGGNDWGNNVRGPRFAEYLRVAVDRIRQQTHGNADVLLMTTCPSHARWETLRELEQAVRDVAAEKKTGLVDVAAEFRKVPNADEALKQEYWAWDKVHLGTKGHEVTKDAVIKAIDAAR
ncbi:MAG: hypothetical protein JWO87_3445 [Phycisphaerales bacterium]|nr:hypothetical protein [Phycisphaerales bacterium]